MKATPVDSLVRVTVAPGTTDPVRSATLPMTRDVVPCANAALDTISMSAMAMTDFRI